MPMPEMPGVLVDLWYRIPISIEEHNKLNRTWDKDRKACFAAGKAEKRPMLPYDGAKFKWGEKGMVFMYYFGCWSSSPWPHNKESDEPFRALDIHGQVALTTAWFQGELEEV